MTTPVLSAPVGSATSSTATTSHAIGLPDGLSVGDLVCIFIRFGSAGTGSPTFSGGGSYSTLFDDISDASNDRTCFYYRRIDGTEGYPSTGASQTIVSSVGTKMAALAWRITGAADPAISPPQASAVSVGTTGTTTNANAVTPTGGPKDFLYLDLVSYDQLGTVGIPEFAPSTGGWTAAGNQSTGAGGTAAQGCFVLAASKGTTGSSSEDPPNWTIAAPNAASSTWCVAIHPITYGPQIAMSGAAAFIPGQYPFSVAQLGQDFSPWVDEPTGVDFGSFNNAGVVLQTSGATTPLPLLLNFHLDFWARRFAFAGTNHVLEARIVPVPAPANYDGGVPFARSEISLGTFSLDSQGTPPFTTDASQAKRYRWQFSESAIATIKANCLVSGWSGKFAISLRCPNDAIIIDNLTAMPLTGIFVPRAAAGTDASVGRADEADSAQALGMSRAYAVGSAAEADLAAALAALRTFAAGTATEADLAQALVALRNYAVSSASEVDLAQALVRGALRSVGLAAESDLAQALAVVIARTYGLAQETDLAVAPTALHDYAAAVAAELDLAAALALLRSYATGRADEFDSALALVLDSGALEAYESELAVRGRYSMQPDVRAHLTGEVGVRGRYSSVLDVRPADEEVCG